MVSKGTAGPRQAPRTGGLRVMLWGRAELAPLQAVSVLLAIYLAKKNIRKQGTLVDYEKVGPPPAPSRLGPAGGPQASFMAPRAS